MKRIFIVTLILSLIAAAGVKQLDGYSDRAVFYQFTHIEQTNTGDYHDGKTTGQPLPSVLFSAMLAIGSIAGVGRLKRR